MIKHKKERAPKSLKLDEKIETSITDESERSYTVDLRVHSPASLGYRLIEGLDAAPALIRVATVKGIDVIGVTDFYSGAFIDRIKDAAKDTSVVIIPGVDIRCSVGACADAEFTCLLPETCSTESVNELLQALRVPPEYYGDSNYKIDTVFEEILDVVESHGGVMLPTRMDKTPMRKAVLPELVEEYGFRTFDLAHQDSVALFEKQWPDIEFNLFMFSNARALAQVGSRNVEMNLRMPVFQEIRTFITRKGEV